MSKKTGKTVKQATFDDFIAKKLQRDNDKNKVVDVYVTSMDKILRFKNPSDDMLLDLIDSISDENNTRKLIEAFKKLIYECCPILQDVKLQEELGVIDPYDTVSELFSISDINEIGEQLYKPIEPNKVKEEIKN